MCEVCNNFFDTFGDKLLMLLHGVEKFFLWVVAATLDGGKPVSTS